MDFEKRNSFSFFLDLVYVAIIYFNKPEPPYSTSIFLLPEGQDLFSVEFDLNHMVLYFIHSHNWSYQRIVHIKIPTVFRLHKAEKFFTLITNFSVVSNTPMCFAVVCEAKN